jgi:hypothetical protein
MARFTDFHDDLILPAAATAQIAEDTRDARTGQFGVRQIDLYHKPQAQCTACLKGQTRKPSASTTRRLESPAARCTKRTASPDQDELRQLAN